MTFSRHQRAARAQEQAVAIVDKRPTRRGGRDIGFAPPEAGGE